jgi:hypothetical protein
VAITKYSVYLAQAPTEDGPATLALVKMVEAASGPAAIKAAVPEPEIGAQYAAIPVRNITIKTAKRREVPPVLFA